MAPKRQSQQPKPPSPPPPPPADSSDDEDQEEEEEEEENASEQSDSEASDDEQSGGDDSESEQDQPTSKPLASAAVAADGKAVAKSSESKSDDNVAFPGDTPAGTSKKAFQRVWSDNDQLALLKGMIDFTDLKDKDPLTNIEDFRLFVQKSLSFPVTESQLVVKIRALRFKYRDNERKDKVFAKANEAEAFKLSRKIWGAEDKKAVGENGGRAGPRKRKDAGDNNGPRHHNPDLAESCAVLTHEMITLCERNVGLSASYVRARINAADESKVKLLEERWKKQKLEEASILARKKALEADILRALMR